MWRGAYTALVTPFNQDGSVDYAMLTSLVHEQVEQGIDGIVPVGTTGESPTLNFDEHRKVIQTVVAAVNGRVKIIAGTGGNATHEALELTRHALDDGADATLQVTPYYNKPSQEGLYRHFSKIADVGLPVVLYNIPGRTCRMIELETLVRLADHPKIVAVKEAAGSVDQVSMYHRSFDLAILSGDDALTLPMMLAGAHGVISVASNIIPTDMTAMVHHALEGRWVEARALHERYHRLFTDLFIETNPVPVKAAMVMMGRIQEMYRLPLCEMNESQKARLEATLKHYGLVSS